MYNAVPSISMIVTVYWSTHGYTWEVSDTWSDTSYTWKVSNTWSTNGYTWEVADTRSTNGYTWEVADTWSTNGYTWEVADTKINNYKNKYNKNRNHHHTTMSNVCFKFYYALYWRAFVLSRRDCYNFQQNRNLYTNIFPFPVIVYCENPNKRNMISFLILKFVNLDYTFY